MGGQPLSHLPTAYLREVVRQNRQMQRVGVYSVCSAHPWVLQAALQQALDDNSVFCVESTSSQVNQEGGYTGQTPRQFAEAVNSLARNAGLPPERVLLGGDHLGPFPWRHQKSAQALDKACQLVRECVLAGYSKIHLDTSMACADDGKALAEDCIAERAAVLCEAAEKTCDQLPSGASPLLYVIGTEVPAPGGETASGGPPAVTTIEHVHRTLQTFQSAFAARGLHSAWERIIALVVQPGVEFGSDVVFDYDRSKTRSLSSGLPANPPLVYEAHSTDYQSQNALTQLVEDHFAILKVGPALTFAFRESIFALAGIEQELLASRKDFKISQVRQALDNAMLSHPAYWQAYYPAGEGEEKLRRLRAYSYSDRCRYYWPVPAVQLEIERLLSNLGQQAIPLTLISQYAPLEYEAVRARKLQPDPHGIIHHHIRNVLRNYATAVGARR